MAEINGAYNMLRLQLMQLLEMFVTSDILIVICIFFGLAGLGISTRNHLVGRIITVLSVILLILGRMLDSF